MPHCHCPMCARRGSSTIHSSPMHSPVVKDAVDYGACETIMSCMCSKAAWERPRDAGILAVDGAGKRCLSDSEAKHLFTTCARAPCDACPPSPCPCAYFNLCLATWVSAKAVGEPLLLPLSVCCPWSALPLAH
eukprot:scaffold92360_cov28-Tisochrysis_lutea.AAC.6